MPKRVNGSVSTAPAVVSLKEACRRLGISYTTGQRWVAEGSFPVMPLPASDCPAPAVRRGRRTLHWFAAADLDVHVDARTKAVVAAAVEDRSSRRSAHPIEVNDVPKRYRAPKKPTIAPTVQPSMAVDLGEACRRLGLSKRTGRRLVSIGKFPIPALPRPMPGMHLRFSTFEIERYLQTASLADVL